MKQEPGFQPQVGGIAQNLQTAHNGTERIRCNSDAALPRPPAQMEGMVQDLQTARDQQRHFEQWHEGRAKGDLDMTVTVLTIGNWPTYKVCPTLPPWGAPLSSINQSSMHPTLKAPRARNML